MTDKLPPNLLALFAPRPPLRYLPPSDHAPEERRTAKITGVAQYLSKLYEPYEPEGYVPTESWLQRRDRLKLEKKEIQQKLLTEGFADYDPAKDPQIRGDAFKTLFVARLSYDVKESDLEREFGRFGPIERIRIVTDSHANDPANSKKKKKKPHRGYAFIVYEREKDMRAAYKETDGIRIKDRRVLVDVERGRTTERWRPRRFGGGLGGRGYTKTVPPRPAGPGAFSAPAGPGGFRGGFRGGFGGRGGFRGGSFSQGGFGGQGRGGLGYQGSGGGFGRGGYGGQANGMGGGQPPPNAPSGPGGGRFGGDRGGGDRGGGDRGGFGSGGYGGSGSYGGDRGGHSSMNDLHAPSGPGAAVNGNGYGDPRGGRSYDDSRTSQRGSGRYGDSRGPGGGSGSNREPVRPRDSGGYRERDRDRDRDRDGGDDRGGYSSRHRDRDDDFSSRKRNFDGDSYEDHRSKRRY